MATIKGFSERIALPHIPKGPGVCIVENESGEVLQIAFSNNIRRRIGNMLDNEGIICAFGPKIFAAMQSGNRIYVRWKLTDDFKEERNLLVDELKPKWI